MPSPTEIQIPNIEAIRRNLTARNEVSREGYSEIRCANRIASLLRGSLALISGLEGPGRNEQIKGLLEPVGKAVEACRVLSEEGRFGLNQGLKNGVINLHKSLLECHIFLDAAVKTLKIPSELRPMEDLFLNRALSSGFDACEAVRKLDR